LSEQKNDLLKKIARIVAGDVGKKVMEVLLEEDEYLTENDIVERTGINVHDVRKALHKMREEALLDFRTERDPETRWIIYYWKVSPEAISDFIRRRKLKIMRKLRQKLEYEKANQFFLCRNPSCNFKAPFETAAKWLFICPKCGSLLDAYDNSSIVLFLEKKIKELEKEVG